MTYDFDMLAVTPKDFQRKYANLLARFGLTDQAKKQLAMFRDPRTAHALQGASEAVRDAFVASGFAVNAYVTEIGEGRYRAADEAERMCVLERLKSAIDALPEDADWNGFDKDVFFAEAYAAEPVAEVQTGVTNTHASPTEVPAQLAKRPLSTPAPSF